MTRDGLAREPDADVLLVGAGGIGAPAAMGLLAAGIRSVVVCDDDAVSLSNLQRQVLFTTGDVGLLKTERLAEALVAREPRLRVGTVSRKIDAASARALAGRARVVIDATDNFEARFLLADACHLAGVPVVHAACIGLRATVMAAPAGGRPCYRCLFERPPEGEAPSCASAGVLGAVCGVAGMLAADRAVRVLAGEAPFGVVTTFDALNLRLRDVPLRPRASCELCGQAPAIVTLDPARYSAQACTGEPRWIQRAPP